MKEIGDVMAGGDDARRICGVLTRTVRRSVIVLQRWWREERRRWNIIGDDDGDDSYVKSCNKLAER